MERPKLPEGLVWRKRPDGKYFKYIYFKVQYRKRRIRGSSGTADPREAERRLRRIKEQIDNQELYGVRPDRPFRFAAEKLMQEFQGSPKTLRMYARSSDELDPWIGDDPLRLICKDRLRPFIEARRAAGVSVRTINLAIAFVRRVLRLAAYYWRDQKGMSWIENCPIIQFEKGPAKKPYPLSWDEQERLFDLLPGRQGVRERGPQLATYLRQAAARCRRGGARRAGPAASRPAHHHAPLLGAGAAQPQGVRGPHCGAAGATYRSSWHKSATTGGDRGAGGLLTACNSPWMFGNNWWAV